MKKGLIVALVAINVALAAALVLSGSVARPASAQVAGGGADYMMMTGQISSGFDAIWVLDLAQRRLVAFRFDKTTKRLVPYRGRELRDDFRRREED